MSDLVAKTNRMPYLYRSFFAKEPYIQCKRALYPIVLWRKEICTLRHSMHLRHPVPPSHVTLITSYASSPPCTTESCAYEFVFPQKSSIIHGSLAERDLQREAFYASSPPCTIESCHTYTQVISSSHVTHIIQGMESCNTYHWVMSHIQHPMHRRYPTSSRVTHINKWYHQVLSHISSRVSSHVTHTIESCHTYKQVVSCRTYRVAKMHRLPQVAGLLS